MTQAARMRLVVDGMNVLGSRPDGWWRDRPTAMHNLTRRLAVLARTTGQQITVVWDGLPLSALPEGDTLGVRVRYARRSGRNSADDRIVDLIAADPNPATLEVITADRELRQRLQRFGAGIRGPQTLLRELDSAAP